MINFFRRDPNNGGEKPKRGKLLYKAVPLNIKAIYLLGRSSATGKVAQNKLRNVTINLQLI